MFEWQWVDDLDGVATADRLVASQKALLAAEAEQLVLATHWADLHAGDFVTARVAMLPGEDDIALRLVPGKDGTQRLLRAAADGCPDLEEYAGAELAALIGTSTAAGNALIW